jgi:hypothetical protein
MTIGSVQQSKRSANGFLKREWLSQVSTSAGSLMKSLSIRRKFVDFYCGILILKPSQNAFSMRLADYVFNFYAMYVPDLMHEFELGVWRAIFKHLPCILYAAGNDIIQTFNKRYVTEILFKLLISLSSPQVSHGSYIWM